MNLPAKPDAVESDEDIERFITENHDDFAAKVEEARLAIERGEVSDMPPLDELLTRLRQRTGVR